MKEDALREQITTIGKSLYDRGLAHGSAGNISAKLADGWLMTPTNSCLGRLDPARIRSPLTRWLANRYRPCYS